MFDYLMSRIHDKYVQDELKRWQEYFRSGLRCKGYRVETLSKTKGVIIRFDKVTIKIDEDQAMALSKDLAEVLIEKSLRRVE